MKYLSLIGFSMALFWSWSRIHSTPAISQETHYSIQQKLAEVILNSLQKQRPSAVDISIDKVWTENLNENKLRAVFAYSFREKGTEGNWISSQIEGTGDLERQRKTEGDEDKWMLANVNTTSDSIVFEDLTVISPGETNQPLETETPAPKPHQPPGKSPGQPAEAPNQ